MTIPELFVVPLYLIILPCFFLFLPFFLSSGLIGYGFFEFRLFHRLL